MEQHFAFTDFRMELRIPECAGSLDGDWTGGLLMVGILETIGPEFDRDWTGIRSGLGRDWIGIGLPKNQRKTKQNKKLGARAACGTGGRTESARGVAKC